MTRIGQLINAMLLGFARAFGLRPGPRQVAFIEGARTPIRRRPGRDPLTVDTWRREVEGLLERQAVTLRDALEAKLETHVAALVESASWHAESAADRLVSRMQELTAEVQSVRSDLSRVRVSLERRLLALENSDLRRERFFDRMETFTANMANLSRDQLERLDRELASRESEIGAIREATSARVAELQSRHRVEKRALHRAQNRETEASLAVHSAIAGRLRDLTAHVERIETRQRAACEASDRADSGGRASGPRRGAVARLWARPLSAWRRRSRSRVRLNALRSQLLSDRADVNDLRDSLQRLTDEVLALSKSRQLALAKAPRRRFPSIADDPTRSWPRFRAVGPVSAAAERQASHPGSQEVLALAPFQPP